MGVRPVDVITMQQMPEVTQIKHNDEVRPVMQQANIVTNVQKEINHRAEQVNQKSDIDNRQRRFDAKDKSDNEYHGNGNKKHKASDGVVKVKGTISGFDIKI